MTEKTDFSTVNQIVLDMPYPEGESDRILVIWDENLAAVLSYHGWSLTEYDQEMDRRLSNFANRLTAKLDLNQKPN